MRRPPRARVGLFVFLGLFAACRSSGGPASIYRPTESVQEVVAVLRLHIDDDTYRFPPARDFTGKNVYRASLERLEALEEIYAAKFRSGYMIDVILFAKARALERIVEYDLAAQHYLRVTDLDSVLVEDAERSRRVCTRLQEARAIGVAPDLSPDEALWAFERRDALLQSLLHEADGTHYGAVLREERERVDDQRARYFAARRWLDPGLEGIALQQYQRLVSRHRESKLHNRHLLELGDFYSGLARDYADRFPAPSLAFDPATFDEYVFGATRLYEAVAHQDGAIEKIEAARKLEAFLAFSLEVRSAALVR